jgi:hypothetical protein
VLLRPVQESETKRCKDRVRINDLQARPRLEVQKLAQHVGLLQASICFPIELDDRGVEILAIVKFHTLAERDFQGEVVRPPPPGCQAWDQVAIGIVLDEPVEDVERNGHPIRRARIDKT